MTPTKLNRNKDAMKSMPSCPQSASSRRRRRQPLLFFLTIAILLSFSLTVGEIDDVCDGHNEDSEEENGCGFIGEGGTVDIGLERDSIEAGRATSTKINIIDKTQNTPEVIISPRSVETQDRIWIIVAYRETCEFSMELVRNLKNHAIPSIEFNNDDLRDLGILHPPEMNFIPMPIDESDTNAVLKTQVLNHIGITRLPSIFFLWDEALVQETLFSTAEVYRGRSESISDLVNGLYHYLSRLQLRASSTSKRRQYQETRDQLSSLATVRVESLQELQNIIRNAKKMKILQNPPLPLDPDLSEDDQKWIRYIMDDDTGDDRDATNNSPEFDRNDEIVEDGGGTNDEAGSRPRRQSIMRNPYHVIVQCRNYMGENMVNEINDGVEGANLQEKRSSLRHSISKLYQEYDQAMKVLGIRRDVIFSIFEPGAVDRGSSQLTSFCDSPSDDGLIRVWDFHSNESLAEVEHDDHRYGYDYVNNSATIIDHLSSWLLPEVLWFDRRMTAPIAFHPRFSRHAILFVDLHDRTSASKTRNAIRVFRQECRRLGIEQQSNINNLSSALNQSLAETIDGNGSETDFVCLIVPSTEIRVLSTFGIDIWSNLDRQATEKIKVTLCNSYNREENDIFDDDFCESYQDDEQSKDRESNDSKFSSVLPTMLVTDRRKDGSIHRHYLDLPINSTSLSEFFHGFIHGRIEPEVKSSHVSFDDAFTKNGRYSFSTNKHFVHLLTAESLPPFLKSNQEKHVLVELYAPTCGHCKRFNTIWNSLGKLIEFLGWSDQLLLARIDVSSNEMIVPGMAATWLPDLFYFGVGVSENPIHYGKTPFADEVELGSISDPLELLEWWMDEAGDVISEAELLHGLKMLTATTISS